MAEGCRTGYRGLRKFGNLPFREILFQSSLYAHLSAHTDTGAGGGESQGNLTGEDIMPSFLAVLLSNHHFSWLELNQSFIHLCFYIQKH